MTCPRWECRDKSSGVCTADCATCPVVGAWRSLQAHRGVHGAVGMMGIPDKYINPVASGIRAIDIGDRGCSVAAAARCAYEIRARAMLGEAHWVYEDGEPRPDPFGRECFSCDHYYEGDGGDMLCSDHSTRSDHIRPNDCQDATCDGL